MGKKRSMNIVELILHKIEDLSIHDLLDDSKLAKIDALVHGYVLGKYAKTIVGLAEPLIYTKSRDLIKSLRPEGYWFQIIPVSKSAWLVSCANEKEGPIMCSGNMPSEELAELHAVIQAINYVRNNTKETKNV